MRNSNRIDRADPLSRDGAKGQAVAILEPANLPADRLALVHEFQRASKAKATVRAYKADASTFSAWCASHRISALPAAPSTLAAFLSEAARAGLASSTLGRRLAAISYAHKLAKLPDPTDDEDVRAAMKGIRRRVEA